MLFAIDERVDVVGGQLKSVTVRYGIGRARLNAVSAENAARIIDVVNFRVPLTGRNPVRVGVLSGLDINAIRRAGRGAQKAADALL